MLVNCIHAMICNVNIYSLCYVYILYFAGIYRNLVLQCWSTLAGHAGHCMPTTPEYAACMYVLN